jgi:hypothetical protein
LPESTNILDPTEESDVKILKDIGLCVDEQFYYQGFIANFKYRKTP